MCSEKLHSTGFFQPRCKKDHSKIFQLKSTTFQLFVQSLRKFYSLIFSKTPQVFWLKQFFFKQWSSIFQFKSKARTSRNEPLKQNETWVIKPLFQKWGSFPPPCFHLPSGHSEKHGKLWQEHPKTNHLGSTVCSCNEHKYQKFLEHEALFVFLVWVGKAPNGVW